MSYLLKFEYSKNYIDDQLLPWKKQLNKFDPEVSDEIIEYQVGTAIKLQNNIIMIVTPFFIHIPYSKCSILNTDIILQLYHYCYFTRVAVYTTTIKNIKFNNINLELNLNNLNNPFIQNLDSSIINLNRLEIFFDNISNQNIYPFIWLKSRINPSIIDDIITGLPIYTNDTLCGIIYNIIDEHIIIIPYINIELNLNLLNNRLSNIFIDIDINEDQQTIIKQSYNSGLNIGDKILMINNLFIDEDSLVFYDKVNIHIPLHTYIWYQSNSNNVFKFKIERNELIFSQNISSKRLDKQISFTISERTNYLIINNIIFCKANLLMVEWLVKNDIIIKSYLYQLYHTNPFYHYKNNYIFIGIIDIIEHPPQINDSINPYMKEIYSITKYMETMTILTINDKKNYNLNKIESIFKLVLCDSNEKEIILDWCC